MDNSWLREIYLEAGFEPEQAERAAEATWTRLLRRETSSIVDRRPKRLVDVLVGDPMVSLNRIIGRGDEGLPYVDPETGELASFSLANTFHEAGLDRIVAQAYANVVVELVGAEGFYRPVWDALALPGSFDLEALRLADWSALRAGHPELEGLPKDPSHETRSSARALGRSPAPPTPGSGPARRPSQAAPTRVDARAQADATRVDARTPGGTQIDARTQGRSARRRPRPKRLEFGLSAGLKQRKALIERAF